MTCFWKENPNNIEEEKLSFWQAWIKHWQIFTLIQPNKPYIQILHIKTQ